MSERIFTVAFAINAALSGNFSQTFSGASKSLQQLNIKAHEIMQSQKRLDAAWRSSQASASTYQNKIAGLYSQFERGKISQETFTREARVLGEAMQRNSMSAEAYRTSMSRLNKELAEVAKQQKVAKAKDGAAENFANARNKLSASYGQFAIASSMGSEIMSPFMGAISSAMDYESALSKVQAITGSNAEEMRRLKDTASQLGATTMFSAKQSAEAMTYLGMAGWKTEQIIAGMPGLLDLAAASGADLATVADIVSDDLTAFGMSADQAGHMADVMAAASSNANTNVELMGATFKYAASVAGTLGYSLEDVSLAAGLMANAGIKGEQAGTSLRAVMTRLASPQAAAAMDRLRISITNTDGTMKPLMQVMEECRSKFAGLNKEEKSQAAYAIAGQEAMSGWLAIMNASDEDFTKLSTAINNSDGAAQKMADTMQDNAQGAMIRLQSAVESINNAVGDVFLPVLADLADKVAAVAGEIGEWASEHENLTGIIAGATVAIGGFVTAVGALGVAGAILETLSKGLAFLGKTSAVSSLTGMLAPLSGILAIGWPLVAVIGAIAAVAAVLYANWDTVCEVATIVTDKISAAWEQTKERLQPTFDKISEAFGRLIEIFGGMGEGSSVVSSILNTLGALIVGIVDIALDCFATLIEVIGTVLDTAVTVFGNILDFVGNVFTGNWQGAWDNI